MYLSDFPNGQAGHHYDHRTLDGGLPAFLDVLDDDCCDILSPIATVLCLLSTLVGVLQEISVLENVQLQLVELSQ
jgi:hypothetical protein